MISIPNALKAIIMMFAFSVLPFSISAQDGWNTIKKNDNISAKKIFLEQLKTDSTNINALYGMIYISELEHDDISYEKYVSCLINNHKHPEHYLLFNDDYNDYDNKLSFVTDSSKTATTALNIENANDLFTERKFNESKKAYSEITGNYDWSVIGPFRSISGYGFVKEYDIEKEKFDSVKPYESGYGPDYKWVKRNLRNNDGVVVFSDNLSDEYGDDVYFANTFITVPEIVKAQFRISRNTPVKIWVDDYLIFQNDENTSFAWDNETTEITLVKGTHRILVKCATLPTETDDYNFLAYHDASGSSSSNYYDDYYSSYYSSLYGSYGSGDEKFAIRITDSEGNLLKNIQSDFSASYTPSTYTAKSFSNKLTDVFKAAIEKNPDELINYYLLCKAYLLSFESVAGEEYFVKLFRKYPDMVFFKYLAAKIYAENGKNENAYLILNDIDESKTPMFALSYENLDKLDKDADEKEYAKMLFHLDTVYPSNWSIIEDVISYYQTKGMNDEKKKFLKEKIAAYPSYKESLEYYLEDENYKPYEYKPETDRDRKKDAKEAMKSLKKNYNQWDYETLITYYKNKENYDKVLSLYNEIISIEPYDYSYLTDKANFLYTREKYDEALTVLFSALEIAPYSESIMETIGDIYSDKKEKEKALEYYDKAFMLERSEYNRESLDDKIKKLVEKDNIKEYFTTKSFDEIISDKGWEGKYTDEKSIVLMYTKDVCLDKQKTTHIYQKLMIKILNDDGARLWTESDFSYMGDLSYVKVVKKNGAEITPDISYGYVVFKNLEPGDIIKMEGTYQGFQENEFNDGMFLLNYISFDAPVYYSKIEVIFPDSIEYKYDCHKVTDNVIKKTTNGYTSYLWEFNDIAKQEEEDDVYDRIDPYAYVWGTTISNWSVLADWYKQKTYKKLEATYEVKEALDTIVKSSMTPFEKVEVVYNFVTKNINYSYVDFLQSNYIPKRPGLTCSAAIGDCKDVATLMISMLRELDIESYYVLVKTNRFFHKFIMPCMLFDHVIVAYMIDGKTYYADPTSNYYPYYCLNENDADSYALLIREGETEVFKLYNYYSDPLNNMQEITIDADFKEDKSITVNAEVVTQGIEAGSLRETVNPMTIEEQKKFIPDYFGEQLLENMKIVSFDFGDLKDISKPLKSSFHLSAENYGDKVTKMLIFRIPFVKTILSSTSLNKEKRYSAIDLSQILNTAPVIQKVSIKIPEGYGLVENPEDILIENKFGKYELKFTQTKGDIKVTKTQIFKSRVVEVEDFDAFKKFYTEIKDADETKLSIKKIE
jgi:tetratricopeptide (TPR) repeat protein